VVSLSSPVYITSLMEKNKHNIQLFSTKLSRSTSHFKVARPPYRSTGTVRLGRTRRGLAWRRSSVLWESSFSGKMRKHVKWLVGFLGISIVVILSLIPLKILSINTQGFKAHSETTMFHNTPVRGVFLLLVIGNDPPESTGSKYVTELHRFLKNFNDKVSSHLNFAYPVLILHDSQNQSIIRDLQTTAKPTSLRFHRIQIPPEESRAKYPDRFIPQHCTEYKSGYRNMNRIFSRLMFEKNSPLLDYEYWFRIDLDVRFKTQIQFDPFMVMKAGDYLFGYHICSMHSGCQHGFIEFVHEYLQSNRNLNVTPSALAAIDNSMLFYGNLGLGNVKFFSSERVLKYLRNIDNNGGIWRERWGDQHIYFSVISIFSHFDKTIHLGSAFLNVRHKTAVLNGKACMQPFDSVRTPEPLFLNNTSQYTLNNISITTQTLQNGFHSLLTFNRADTLEPSRSA